MNSAPHLRSGNPVLLADQLVAWSQYRAGWGVTDIGVMLRRLPAETRAILHGDAR